MGPWHTDGPGADDDAARIARAVEGDDGSYADQLAVKMMFKQVGMTRAIVSGKFDDDMLAWTVTIMRQTETFKSETDNNTLISLRGENPEFLFTDDELQGLNMLVLLL